VNGPARFSFAAESYERNPDPKPPIALLTISKAIERQSEAMGPRSSGSFEGEPVIAFWLCEV